LFDVNVLSDIMGGFLCLETDLLNFIQSI
jgi:hypothetical protein